MFFKISFTVTKHTKLHVLCGQLEKYDLACALKNSDNNQICYIMCIKSRKMDTCADQWAHGVHVNMDSVSASEGILINVIC